MSKGIAKVAGFNTFVSLNNNGAKLIRVDRVSSAFMGRVGSILGINSRIAIGIVSVTSSKGVNLSVHGTISGPTKRISEPRQRDEPCRGDAAPHPRNSFSGNEGSFSTRRSGNLGGSFSSLVDDFLGSDRSHLASVGHGARNGHKNHNNEHK